MTSPFDFIGSFSSKKEYLYDDRLSKDYVPFIINRGLSFSVQTLFYANEMNCSSALDKKLQHDFYFYFLPKTKSYNKWIKGEKSSAEETLIANKYNVSLEKAREYMKLLSPEQIEAIEQSMNKGGKHDRSATKRAR